MNNKGGHFLRSRHAALMDPNYSYFPLTSGHKAPAVVKEREDPGKEEEEEEEEEAFIDVSSPPCQTLQQPPLPPLTAPIEIEENSEEEEDEGSVSSDEDEEVVEIKPPPKKQKPIDPNEPSEAEDDVILLDSTKTPPSVSPPADAIEDQAIPEETEICPICLELCRKKVTAKGCGHSFCSVCILTFLSRYLKVCPACRHPLTKSQLQSPSSKK